MALNTLKCNHMTN